MSIIQKSFTIILVLERIQPSEQIAANQVRSQPQQVRGLVRLAKELESSTGASGIQPSDNQQKSASALPRANANQLVGAPSSGLDRHVLTETEVVPVLESKKNRHWSFRSSRSLKSSLTYKFSVYCSMNYFGDGCTTFCRQRDDQFGHYNCSSTGQKICLEGWTGPDCDKARCRSGCSQQHGYCDKPDTCQCRPGWSGPRCDECLVYPGCANGYCLSSWQCICRRQWGGVLCDQELDYCGNHEPCQNGASCQNVGPGRYKCNCAEGFAGVNCELDIRRQATKSSIDLQISAGCAMNPCLNGGTCYGFGKLPNLASVQQQTIQANQQHEPAFATDAQSPISTYPFSETSEAFYRCHCQPGWSGDYCQWSDSVASSLTAISAIINETSNQTPTANVTEQATYIESPEEMMQPILATDDQQSPFGDKFVTPETSAGLASMSAATSVATAALAHGHQHLQHHHQLQLHHQINLPRLLSGVMLASIVGVFLAATVIVWCCLVAIQRNFFDFIQMNIIQAMDASDRNGATGSSSRFARMQQKIRDSLRRSSRLKSETKLCLDNVLKPPSYEESNHVSSYSTISKPAMPFHVAGPSGDSKQVSPANTVLSSSEASLVIRGAIGQKLASAGCLDEPPIELNSHEIEVAQSDLEAASNCGKAAITGLPQLNIEDYKLNCPKHGHLYKKQLGPRPTYIHIPYHNHQNTSD